MAAAPNPSKIATTPRIAKLIELEVRGVIKPEHQNELDVLRAQGRAPKKLTNDLTEAQGKSTGFYARALNANKDFEGTAVAETPRGLIAQVAADAAPGIANKFSSAERQKAVQAKENFIRASLRYESGASIGQPEFDAQDKIFFPQPGDSPEVIAQKADARLDVIKSLDVSSGAGSDEIENTPPGENGQSRLAAPAIGLSDGGTETTIDPELAGVRKQVAGLLAGGSSAKAIRNYLVSAGVDPTGVQGIDEAVDWRKRNPKYRGGYDVRIGVQDLPISASREVLNDVAQSPVGAYAMGAADAVTGGFLDELAPGNTELNNLGKNLVAQENPVASGLGTFTGAAGVALGGELGLASRGVRYAPALADTAYGALYGAGSDNDSRLTGALTGGATALGGGLLGREAVALGGRALAPTGGKLGPLYEAGVRPTIGQRFVGTGTIGNAVNGFEEILQSVPIAGFAVRGARQKARDQFERGAFDSALGEIGQKLPTKLELGTKPHALMQDSFSEAYDNVLPNMRAVADEDFNAATKGILDEVDAGGLAPDSASRFRTIIDAQVSRRLGDVGEMSGTDLKAAVSNIGKRIQSLRSSPQGDRELASALEDYVGALKASAMRNSDPGAAAALEAVDRGYAKAVRIEDAASARGGDTGRFSPTQFDRYVQKDSGGTRSRAYLRGDALFGDYAEAGKSLVDRIPNSGTADRLLATQALGGAPIMSALGYASLPLAGGVAGATSLYAPIARDAVGAALAPRQNTLGNFLRNQRVQQSGGLGLLGAGQTYLETNR